MQEWTTHGEKYALLLLLTTTTDDEQIQIQINHATIRRNRRRILRILHCNVVENDGGGKNWWWKTLSPCCGNGAKNVTHSIFGASMHASTTSMDGAF
jgi:hypothetical protein